MNIIITLLALVAALAYFLGNQGHKTAKFASPFLMIGVTFCVILKLFSGNLDGRQISGIPIERKTSMGIHQGKLLASKWSKAKSSRILILTFAQNEANMQSYNSLKKGLEQSLPECKIEFYDTQISPKKQRLKADEIQQLAEMDWDICLSMVGFPANANKLKETCLFNPEVRGQRKFVVMDGEQELMQDLLDSGMIDMFFTRDFSKESNDN